MQKYHPKPSMIDNSCTKAKYAALHYKCALYKGHRQYPLSDKCQKQGAMQINWRERKEIMREVVAWLYGEYKTKLPVIFHTGGLLNRLQETR